MYGSVTGVASANDRLRAAQLAGALDRSGGRASGQIHDYGFFFTAAFGSGADRQKIECRQEMDFRDIAELLDFNMLVGTSKVVRRQPTDH